MLNFQREEAVPGSIDTLHRVVEFGDVQQLHELLRTGLDVDATTTHGTTALMKASLRGHLQMVRTLLNYGANPNCVRNDQFTALALAAFFGYEDIVKLLVEHGADPNAKTRFRTSPQMWASARTFRGVASYLSD